MDPQTRYSPFAKEIVSLNNPKKLLIIEYYYKDYKKERTNQIDVKKLK